MFQKRKPLRIGPTAPIKVMSFKVTGISLPSREPNRLYSKVQFYKRWSFKFHIIVLIIEVVRTPDKRTLWPPPSRVTGLVAVYWLSVSYNLSLSVMLMKFIQQPTRLSKETKAIMRVTVEMNENNCYNVTKMSPLCVPGSWSLNSPSPKELNCFK